MVFSDSRLMKYIQVISRLFVGAIFIFSGFVKAIDPSGSAIKLMEYFEAFHLGIFHITAFPLAILLSSMELMIGINLVASVRMRFTGWLLIVFMSFFTLLTFILAITNPVSDCGCFGDAIKLTNWETFWKNIILMVPSLVIFLRRDHFRSLLKSLSDSIMAGAGFLAAVLLSLYCIIHLPLIDFRPYRTGTNIPENMTLPEGALLDEYETILVYEKNGVREEFTTADYPWQDSSWVWVETKQKLISKGEVPLIHDFSISTPEGNDITETVLSDPGYTLLLISPALEKANKKFMERANGLAAQCEEQGICFMCLTSSTDNQIRTYKAENQPDFDIFTTDETTLKTIVRANPGLLLLREGTILGKWNFRDAPPADQLKGDMTSVSLSMQQKKRERLAVLVVFLMAVVGYGGLWLLLKKKEDRSRNEKAPAGPSHQ